MMTTTATTTPIITDSIKRPADAPPSSSSLKTQIERYDAQSGDLYLRSFGIKENTIAKNSKQWIATNLKKWINTFKHKDVIITPNYNHYVDPSDTTAEEWIENQKPFAIGSIEDIIYNENTQAYDFIWKVTKESAKKAILEGHIPPYVSPAIYGKKVSFIEGGNIRLFEDAIGIHLAIVKKPAFGDIAIINNNTCTGEGIKCKAELAAVAAATVTTTTTTTSTDTTPSILTTTAIASLDSDNNNSSRSSNMSKSTDYYYYYNLLKNISSDIPLSSFTKNNITMSESQTKMIPYEEFLKLSNERDSLRSERDSFKSKYEEALSSNKKTVEEIQSKYKDLETKWNERLIQDKIKIFDSKLSKVFKDESERKQKIDFFIEKGYTDEDIDNIYGHVIKQAEDSADVAENINGELQSQSSSQQQQQQQISRNVGIASSSSSSTSYVNNNNPLSAYYKEGIALALRIAGRRSLF